MAAVQPFFVVELEFVPCSFVRSLLVHVREKVPHISYIQISGFLFLLKTIPVQKLKFLDELKFFDWAPPPRPNSVPILSITPIFGTPYISEFGTSTAAVL